MARLYVCSFSGRRGLCVLTSAPDYNQPSPSQVGLLNSIWAVGSLVALPVVPYTADILGRRTGVMVGCSIMLGGVALQTLGFTFAMFVSARFFLGFGVAIAHGASPLLITELVHPQHRAIYTAIYNTTWYMGSLLAAWLTFGKFSIGFIPRQDQHFGRRLINTIRHQQDPKQLGMENTLLGPGTAIVTANVLYLVCIIYFAKTCYRTTF